MWQNVYDAISGVLFFLPRIFFEFISEFVELALAELPDIPILDFSNLFSSVGPEVLYIFNLLEFQYGLTVVFSAYGARFLLRRIPFFG